MGNNPINRMDPSGLQAAGMGLGISGGGGWTPVQPGGPSYDQTRMAAQRAQSVAQMNRFTQAQSRGMRQPHCGPTGVLGGFLRWLQSPDAIAEWLRSPEAGIAAIVVSGAIVVGATALVLSTYGPATLFPIGIGAATGAASGVIGQVVQDMAMGRWSSPEVYVQQMLVGALGGGVASVIGLAGATLGLPPAVTGAISGFAVGTLSQAAANALSGKPLYEGVVQMGVSGLAGGAVSGFIGGFVPSGANVLTRMGVGGATGALVSGGTQSVGNVLAGRDWREGVGQAVAVGATTGVVDAAMDFYADRLAEPQWAASLLRKVGVGLAGVKKHGLAWFRRSTPSLDALPDLKATRASTPFNKIGFEKDIYDVLSVERHSPEDVVWLQPKWWGGPNLLEGELAGLKILEEYGLPTPLNLGKTAYTGRLGIEKVAVIQERMVKGSRNYIEMFEASDLAGLRASPLNERTIQDLQDIKRSLIEQQLRIPDLQFLVARDGRVVINDPQMPRRVAPGSELGLGELDDLMNAAREAIRLRTQK